MFIRTDENLKSSNIMDLHILKIYIIIREVMAMLHDAKKSLGSPK